MLDFHCFGSLRPASALGRVPPQQLALQAGWNARPRAFGGGRTLWIPSHSIAHRALTRLPRSISSSHLPRDASTGVTSCGVVPHSACRFPSWEPCSRPAAATMTTTHRRPTGPPKAPAGHRRRNRDDGSGRGWSGGWNDPRRQPEAGRPARSGGDAGPRHLRRHRSVLRVPLHARRHRHRARARRVVGAERRRQRLDVQPSPRASSGTTAPTSRPPTSPRRWIDSSSSATRASRASSKPALSIPRDPNIAVFTLVSPNGNFPYLVSVYNAQSVITPVAYELGYDARRVAERHRGVQVRRRQLGPGDRRHVRTQPRLVGRRDPARRQRLELLRRRGHDGHGHGGRRGRRHRPVPGQRRRRAVQRPELQRARHACCHPPADLDALRRRPVRRQAGASGAGVVASIATSSSRRSSAVRPTSATTT